MQFVLWSAYIVRNKGSLGKSKVGNLKCPVQEFDSVNMFHRNDRKQYFKINSNAENRRGPKSKDPKTSRPNDKSIN